MTCLPGDDYVRCDLLGSVVAELSLFHREEISGRGGREARNAVSRAVLDAAMRSRYWEDTVSFAFEAGGIRWEVCVIVDQDPRVVLEHARAILKRAFDEAEAKAVERAAKP